MKTYRIIDSGYRPPDPQAVCVCGKDDADDSPVLRPRLAIVCPKHDGEVYDIVEEAPEVVPETGNAY